MTSARQAAERCFPRDIDQHEMQVLRDDGLYRHLRFARPDTGNMSFDILTWPGYLAYVGDMGSYVFHRLEDMLQFFRGDLINPSYWAEKVEAQDKGDGIKEYSPELARLRILEHLEDAEAPDWVREEAADFNYDDGEYAIRSDIEGTGWDGFADHYEISFRDYTYRYIWCCLALVWAVKKYDTSGSRRGPTDDRCMRRIIADISLVAGEALSNGGHEVEALEEIFKLADSANPAPPSVDLPTIFDRRGPEEEG